MKILANEMMKRRQQVQYEHDFLNHFDILSLPRPERLKHYGLHFAKYAGRFSRGADEIKSRSDTLVDAFLVSLSAANALNQELPDMGAVDECNEACLTTDLVFTDQAGRFADACEKIDHLEEFRDIALAANEAIMRWIIRTASTGDIDLDGLVEQRREQLARRAVYCR